MVFDNTHTHYTMEVSTPGWVLKWWGCDVALQLSLCVDFACSLVSTASLGQEEYQRIGKPGMDEFPRFVVCACLTMSSRSLME